MYGNIRKPFIPQLPLDAVQEKSAHKGNKRKRRDKQSVSHEECANEKKRKTSVRDSPDSVIEVKHESMLRQSSSTSTSQDFQGAFSLSMGIRDQILELQETIKRQRDDLRHRISDSNGENNQISRSSSAATSLPLSLRIPWLRCLAFLAILTRERNPALEQKSSDQDDLATVSELICRKLSLSSLYGASAHLLVESQRI